MRQAVLAAVLSLGGIGVVPAATLTGSTPYTFSITNATYGTFTASSGTIFTQTASFLDVYLLGSFTPANPGPLETFDDTPSSFRISINQSGSSLSEAMTLVAPPAGIPEPASLLLVGGALVGLGTLRRKKE